MSKIQRVVANNRKHAFEVTSGETTWDFPYAKCVECIPDPSDPVIECNPDPELGDEGFVYRLRSGKECSIHLDSVLEENSDPTYMADLAIYRLTVEAVKALESSHLSVRTVARRLGTSPTQVYRLLDTTNYSKSLRQLLALVSVLGHGVRFEFDPSFGVEVLSESARSSNDVPNHIDARWIADLPDRERRFERQDA